MKIKLFVAREIQYFDLGIFSFNSDVYYLTHGFIAWTLAFNLLTRAFNLPTSAFSLPTRDFNLATRAFSVLTREFKLVTRGFELVTRGFELVTRVLLFHVILYAAVPVLWADILDFNFYFLVSNKFLSYANVWKN